MSQFSKSDQFREIFKCQRRVMQRADPAGSRITLESTIPLLHAAFSAQQRPSLWVASLFGGSHCVSSCASTRGNERCVARNNTRPICFAQRRSTGPSDVEPSSPKTFHIGCIPAEVNRRLQSNNGLVCPWSEAVTTSPAAPTLSTTSRGPCGRTGGQLEIKQPA